MADHLGDSASGCGGAWGQAGPSGASGPSQGSPGSRQGCPQAQGRGDAERGPVLGLPVWGGPSLVAAFRYFLPEGLLRSSSENAPLSASGPVVCTQGCSQSPFWSWLLTPSLAAGPHSTWETHGGTWLPPPEGQQLGRRWRVHCAQRGGCASSSVFDYWWETSAGECR